MLLTDPPPPPPPQSESQGSQSHTAGRHSSSLTLGLFSDCCLKTHWLTQQQEQEQLEAAKQQQQMTLPQLKSLTPLVD